MSRIGNRIGDYVSKITGYSSADIDSEIEKGRAKGYFRAGDALMRSTSLEAVDEVPIDGGDLRVAHFFGLHAMHVLPLVAWALARWLPPRRALPAVTLFTVIYTGWTLFTLLTAWRGQPLV